MSTPPSKIPSKPTDSKRKSRVNAAEAIVAPPANKEEPQAATESAPTTQRPAKAKASKEAKKQGAKQQERVRDRFTFPAEDYALIGSLKQRILLAGRKVKKSEILRAGLISLSAFDDAELLRVVDGIVKVRPDRPEK